MAAKPSSKLGGGVGVILEIKQFVVFGESLPSNRIPTSLRGRRLKWKEKGVLGARETRGETRGARPSRFSRT